MGSSHFILVGLKGLLTSNTYLTCNWIAGWVQIRRMVPPYILHGLVDGI